MPRRTWFRGGPAIAGFVLAGLALAGCAHQPPARQQASLASCTAFSISVLRHHVTVTSLPAACRGLTKSQLHRAAGTALQAVAEAVPGKVRILPRARELRLLLGHVATPVAARPSPPPAPAAAGPVGPPSRVVALIGWLITVGLGSLMMARWIARTGFRRLFTGKARSAAALNFAHLGLAVAGLLIWIGYLLTSLTALAWTGCALLLPVAGLGMALVSRWFPDRSPAPAMVPAGVTAGAAPSASVTAPAPFDPDPPPVQHPPVPVVAAHVVFAVTTILFAVLAAIGPR
ncbi:MAG TPA: hypothetical protein VIX86_23770 [Streptosporangiaceae bacterium]